MHILTKPFASFCGRCLLQACNLLFHLIHSCCYGRKRIQAFSLALPWSTCGNEDPPAPSDSSLPLLLLLLLQAALGAGVSRAVYRVSSSQPLEVPLSGLSDVSPFWEKKQTAVSRGWGYSRWGWIALGLLCVTVCVCYQKKKKNPPTKPSRTLNSCPFLMGTCKSEAFFGLINRTCKYCSFFLTKLTCCMPVSCNFILVRWLGGLSRRQGEGTLTYPRNKVLCATTYLQAPCCSSD